MDKVEEEGGQLQVAVSLLLLLVLVFLFVSLSVAGKLSAQFARFKVFFLIAGVLHLLSEELSLFWLAFRAFRIVVERCQPIILRIFGVGGQGFLHLGSLYFIDIAKLSPQDVLWRFIAGGYTTILAVFFLVPLVLLLAAYWSPMEDVVAKECQVDNLAKKKQEEERDRNEVATGDRRSEQEPREELLNHFDMNAFLVLAQLGTGTTGVVTLARVDHYVARHHQQNSDSTTCEDQDRMSEQKGVVKRKPNLSIITQDDEEEYEESSQRDNRVIQLNELGATQRRDNSTSRGVEIETRGPLLSPLRQLLHTSGPSKAREAPFLVSPRAPLSPKFAKDVLIHQSMKRNTRSVPSQLNMLQTTPVDETDPDWWAGVKWINQNESSSRDLGLTNSGLPRDDEARFEGFDSQPDSALTNTDKRPSSNALDMTPQKHWNRARRSRVESSGTTGSETDLQQEHKSPVSNEQLLGEHHENVDSAAAVFFPLSEMPDLVAIKTMHKRKITAMGMKRCVERERQVMGMIDSPFLCTMYGAFQDDAWAYLLLEPVPAGDLASLLEARSIMFESEARFYMGCVLLATEHLHDRGIACLDIKPENMLLDQWGYLKICDFGIAKIFSSTTDAQKVETLRTDTDRWEFTGTPEYMAPEVIRTESIAPGLVGLTGPDTWAIGILLFELLVGATPFSSEFGDNQETVRNVRLFAKECEERDLRYRDVSSSFWSSLGRVGKSQPDTPFVLQKRLQENMSEEDSCLRSSWFAEIRSKSDAARDLVLRLLRPNPFQRLGMDVTPNGKRGGDVCRRVMQHPWFSLQEEGEALFSWNQLAKQNVYPPFIPDPASLAPPFRGEMGGKDITNSSPLTFAEFQAVRDEQSLGLLSSQTGQSRRTGRVDEFPWRGFIQASRSSISSAQLERCKPQAQAVMRSGGDS